MVRWSGTKWDALLSTEMPRTPLGQPGPTVSRRTATGHPFQGQVVDCFALPPAGGLLRTIRANPDLDMVHSGQ